MTTLEENIARLKEAIAATREATREANAAVKDLREERRQVERLLGTTAAKLVEDQVGELVRKELDRIGPMLQEQSHAIYARVGDQVDKLIDLSLGKEFAVGKRREDIRPALAEKLRHWVREVLESGPESRRGDGEQSR